MASASTLVKRFSVSCSSKFHRFVGNNSVKLALSGQTVFIERIDTLTTDYFAEIMQVVADAVNRRDNIGLDEFPTQSHLQVGLI